MGWASCALALDVLRSETLVTALSATSCTNCVTCVAAHANLAMQQASFSFRESCHGLATRSPYLIATELLEADALRKERSWRLCKYLEGVVGFG